MDWIELNFHQTLTSMETLFNVIKPNETKFGKNLLTLRLAVINKKNQNCASKPMTECILGQVQANFNPSYFTKYIVIKCCVKGF